VFLDKINRAIGKGVANLTLLMVLVTFIVVVLRYGFNLGWIWLQEIVTWMHAAVFLLAAAYTFSEDAHVRVDVFYRNWSQRTKNKVNLIGNVFCLCNSLAFTCRQFGLCVCLLGDAGKLSGSRWVGIPVDSTAKNIDSFDWTDAVFPRLSACL